MEQKVSEEKIKILTISDHPLSPSGVGTQTKYMIEAMLDTKKFKFVCLGGAIKHENYQPSQVEPYGEDWIIFPIDGYGNEEVIRSMIRTHKPDILWFMTDPRFYEWLWGIENEIRPLVPMVYYHVWDNYPYPDYNKSYYISNDFIATISKVTDDIVKTVAPGVDSQYLPHSVNTEIFKKHEEELVEKFREEILNDEHEGKFILFWNNRNARRKQTGSVVWWYKELLDRIGNDKTTLILHTEPKDPHGQDLEVLISTLGMKSEQILISPNKIPPEHLSLLYNIVNCTVNIADAEGFGLGTLESLACETPIVVNMTGGLQEQVTDGEEFFGVGITPVSRSVIGSQTVPYIYEDRINNVEFVDALEKMYNMWNDHPEEYAELGKKGRQHVLKNYNYEKFKDSWEKVLLEVHEKHGSWDNRKNHKSWELIEV